MTATAQFKNKKDEIKLALSLALDSLKRHIEINYGKRCKEDVAGCGICDAWFFFDQLEEWINENSPRKST